MNRSSVRRDRSAPRKAFDACLTSNPEIHNYLSRSSTLNSQIHSGNRVARTAFSEGLSRYLEASLGAIAGSKQAILISLICAGIQDTLARLEVELCESEEHSLLDKWTLLERFPSKQCLTSLASEVSRLKELTPGLRNLLRVRWSEYMSAWVYFLALFLFKSLELRRPPTPIFVGFLREVHRLRMRDPAAETGVAEVVAMVLAYALELFDETELARKKSSK